MKAVILAAGRGTRMRYLTDNLPKVMVQINGKPILAHLIGSLKQAGITDIALIVGYKQEAIRNYFGDSVTYIEQKEQLGTGNAIICAQSFTGDEPFIAVSGDGLWHSDDIKKMIRPANLVSVYHTDTPERYGVVLENNGVFERIVEKPKREDTPSSLVNTGLYTFTSKIYDEIQKLSPGTNGEYLLVETFSALRPEIVYLEHGWIDVGCPEDVPVAEKRLQEFV